MAALSESARPDAQVSGIYNFRAVDERLATSGQPSEAELAAVAQEGFEVVVNLALHDDPRYSLADEAATVAALGMQYVHIPVRFDAPGEEYLALFFAAMEKHAGKKIWLHCAANKRVSAFLGLYRALRLGWAEQEAFSPMRDIWEPDAVWAAFVGEMLGKRRPP